jgi:mannose-1-phosphate guanylyltransferase
VLEPETLDRIAPATVCSIEREYFPSLVASGETFVAHVDRGYWIDIGTPAKYRQAHRDIMAGRFRAAPFADAPGTALVAPGAHIDDGATIEAPCFIDAGAMIARKARVGPYSVIGAGARLEEGAEVDGAILWPRTAIAEGARLDGVLAGHDCRIGRHVEIRSDAVLGDRSVVTDYSRA